MNPEKVVFGFFIVMSLTLNFSFCLGEIDNPDYHNVYELAAAIFVNLVATILKFGDRSQVGALLLSTSLVANLQLFAAAITQNPHEKLDHLVAIAKQFFPLRDSTKHMSGRDWGRLEPTSSLKL